eukprot:COSAG06_NODE_1428_length_9487_cov_195.907861_10_plen_99_part_00
MATPTVRAAIAVAQGDTPAVVKLLRDGMLPPDYKFKPEEVGRSENGLSPPFCTKMIILSRQARDKHRENSSSFLVFLAATIPASICCTSPPRPSTAPS